MTTPPPTTTTATNEPAHENEYVLGTNEAELHRLGFQHRLWFVPAHRLWERARLSPGMKVLDVGCGPGFASMDMAQLVTRSGRVVGVDESASYVEFAKGQAVGRQQPQARFYVGDVTHIDRVLGEQGARDGIEPGSFDMAYIRWVMCFVDDPVATISSIARMLKPGGKLLIQDYFNYDSMRVAPPSEAFETVIAAIAKSWVEHGGDTDIMGKLPRIAIDAGLQIEHLAQAQIETPRPGTTMWNWPDSFWPVFIPRLEELGYISADEHEAFKRAWVETSNDPAAFMHLPPVYEMIAVKPE
ncbi:MAG: methyltransferase domain-containing protein [Phycisphaerales bacterium]